MRENIVERRQKLLNMRCRGVSLSESVKTIAVEYGVSTRAVYRDWATRKSWLPSLLDLGDTETFFLDLICQHKEIVRLSTMEYLKGDNSNARVGALRLLRDLNLDLFEVFQLRDVNERLDAIEELARKEGLMG